MLGVMILVLGCTIWFPLMIWIVSLVHWMIMGEVDFVSGILGIWLAVGLGYTAIKPPIPILSPIAYVLVLVTIVAYPFVRAGMDKRELKGVEIFAIEKAYETLGVRPTNSLAKFKLARHVYNVGIIGHAVVIADQLIKEMPESHFLEEHRTLRRWKQAGVPPDTLRAIECVECRTMCPAGWTHCQTCGAPFLLHRARGRVLGTGQGKKLIAAWIAMVAVLGGIPASTTLPPLLSIIAILALISASIAIVYLTFRSPARSAAA